MSRSPELPSAQSVVTAVSLALLTTFPTFAQAATLSASSSNLPGAIASNVAQPATDAVNQHNSQGWLIADKDDKPNKNNKKGRKGDRDDDDNQTVRIDLNRAKNLARQAAEAANGGIRVYRAEASMHGPANLCPYVDNGDSWTFTFLGSRPGATTMTIESVVTVYKNSPRVLVAYNGAIRNVTQTQTQVVTFSTSQRTVISELLRGTCSCNNLITDSYRTQIISQARSLPPGIQKQLLRGKGLPPGIAKKLLPLPKQVNTYLNIPAQYDLVVVGSNVVLIDQVRYVVVDLITNVI